MQNIEWRELEEGLIPFHNGNRVAWAPQEGSQTVFLASPVFETLYEGTRGPGKTDTLLVSFGRNCDNGWGRYWRGILFRHTYKQLEEVIEKSQRLIPTIWPSARYNASANYWTWPDGERLFFRHFERASDYTNYHGHEYSWIGWDELTTWPDDVGYKRMMSLCRCKKAGIPNMIRATTNPMGIGHNWVKDRFRLPLTPGAIAGPIIKGECIVPGEKPKERIAIRGQLDENKVLLYAEPEYKATLAESASSQAELDAWLYGSWDIVAGGMVAPAPVRYFSSSP